MRNTSLCPDLIDSPCNCVNKADSGSVRISCEASQSDAGKIRSYLNNLTIANLEIVQISAIGSNFGIFSDNFLANKIVGLLELSCSQTTNPLQFSKLAFVSETHECTLQRFRVLSCSLGQFDAQIFKNCESLVSFFLLCACALFNYFGTS